MKPCVLIAAPVALSRHLSDALGASFTLMVCVEPPRMVALLAVGCFQAAVIAESFVAESRLGDPDLPIVRVPPGADPGRIAVDVAAAVADRRRDERRRARDLVPLTEVAYHEYLDLVRFRATRQYLLGLMQRHDGSVTEAAHQAGLVRESLHRLLRRHDVDADRFRTSSD